MKKNNNTSQLEIDFALHSLITNPYLVYKNWREQGPVIYSKAANAWVIVDYKPIKYALENPKIFSSVGTNNILLPTWLHNKVIRDYPLVFDDAPRHTSRRKFLLDFYSRKPISKLKPYMEMIATSLIGAIKPGFPTEFFSTYAQPFTDNILAKHIGIDDLSPFEDLRAWTKLVENPPFKVSEVHAKNLEFRQQKSSQHIETLIEERLSCPRDDLISAVANPSTLTLTKTESRDIIELILLAGMQTTPHMLSRAVAHLSYNPTIFAKLKNDVSLIPQYLTELIRHDPPVHLTARKTKKEVNCWNIPIPENANVILAIASGNHDDKHYSNPERFELERKKNNHLGFGGGVHLCIGHELAKTQLPIALEKLITNHSSFKCRPRHELPWFYSYAVHGFDELLVTFEK